MRTPRRWQLLWASRALGKRGREAPGIKNCNKTKIYSLCDKKLPL